MKRDLLIDDTLQAFEVKEGPGGELLIMVEGEEFSFTPHEHSGHDKKYLFSSGSEQTSSWLADDHVSVGTFDVTVRDPKNLKRVLGAQTGGGGLKSPMPGKILQVLVRVGDKVTVGEPLLVMEAMKMEHTIKANATGVVSKLDYQEGDLIDGGVSLCTIDEES